MIISIKTIAALRLGLVEQGAGFPGLKPYRRQIFHVDLEEVAHLNLLIKLKEKDRRLLFLSQDD